jgi:hypothetical protein
MIRKPAVALAFSALVAVACAPSTHPPADRDAAEVVHVAPAADASLEAWILDRPRIASAIRWEDVAGFRAYPAWTPAERAQLDEYFGYARSGMFPMEPVPANLWDLEDWEPPTTVLSESDARALYLAHVGQALWTEISGAVAWSIQEYSSEQLATLLGGESFFALDRPQFPGVSAAGRPGGYHLVHMGLPAPPHVVLAFLTEHDLIGATPRSTIENVLGWSRGLRHFLGQIRTAIFEDHWHYRGVTPLIRVLEGTVNSEYEHLGHRYWTGGCHGTNVVLRDILRIVNIPVEYRTVAGHATPYFPTEQVYLSHGDDPYNALVNGRFPPLPGSDELLIDVATWESWFGDAVPAAEKVAGIGRRPRELSVAYLPEYVLYERCGDLDAGASREDGSLYALYRQLYTLAELDSLTLRVDRRISVLGGCDEIVQPASAPGPVELPPGIGRTTVHPRMSESGTVRSNGLVMDVINVGDTPDGVSAQVFLSFDLSAIPIGATIIDAAFEFRSRDGYGLLGNPFDLGCLLLYSHEYGTLESDDFVAGTPPGELGRWCGPGEPPTVRLHADGAELIRAALQRSAGAARARFRMQFEKATNGDDAADMVRLNWQFRLVITYALEPAAS